MLQCIGWNPLYGVGKTQLSILMLVSVPCHATVRYFLWAYFRYERAECVMNDFITALQKLVQHHGCGRTKLDQLSEY